MTETKQLRIGIKKDKIYCFKCGEEIPGDYDQSYCPGCWEDFPEDHEGLLDLSEYLEEAEP